MMVFFLLYLYAFVQLYIWVVFCESSCGSLFALYLHTRGCPGSGLNFSPSFDISLVLLAINYYREQRILRYWRNPLEFII